ncbi:DUF6273 domain-containing protein [Anaerocolumna cellulosilytica]|uniref:DUF6273 domain-containing protein n=1 Tax=Anaerocolumna cellulosilytica TaxID=433286 RepID=UPI00160F568B|nr:DUF6273 domain-containing protein [Anaerocolumna cellulosilytica]MBB5198096.1 co-chaperonin GroES (HSP10) [Anaerocolumna cellulosilytica]
MSGLKRVVKALLCIILLVGVVIIGAENFTTVSAEVKPTASVTKKTLYVKGSPYTIKVNNASAKAVITYSSSNKAVATVSKSGVITPVKTGTATVTVKVVQNGSTYNSKIAVAVKESKVISYLQYGTKEVTECYDNEDYNLGVYFPDLENYKYSYTLSDSAIIDITKSHENDGIYKIYFKTLKLGSVTITVKENFTGLSYSKKINVVNSDSDVEYKGEMITFGCYPQSEVVGIELTDEIVNADYNDNEATINGVKYLRITYRDVKYTMNSSYKWNWEQERTEVPYHYFRYEPIAWRVLNDDNGTLLLVSDKILYNENYNNASEAITWEKASIRNELNTMFLHQAFSENEQKSILTTTVENKDTKTVFRYDEEKNKIIEDTSNGKGGKGGKSTKDKVFLLSLEETLNPQYWTGIKKNSNMLQRAEFLNSRMAYCSDYALFSGCIANSKSRSSQWMLRSPAESNYFVSGVSFLGDVSSYGADSWTAYFGIRPAIKIKRSELNR